MKLSTKILITLPVLAAAGVLVGTSMPRGDVAAAVAPALEAPAPAGETASKPVGGPEAATPASGPSAAPASPTPSPAAKRFRDLDERAQRLSAMTRARARRAAEHPDEDPLPEISPVDYFEHVDEEVERDLIQFAQDCSALADTRVEGRLVLRFHVALEPELGGIIEDVEAHSRLEQPEVAQCIRESAYMLDLPAYPEPGRMIFAAQLELEPTRPAPQ